MNPATYNTDKMGSYLVPLTIIVLVVLVLLSFALFRTNNHRVERGRRKKRDRGSILREANRRLSQNPSDPHALLSLADLYFDEGDYENALSHYQKCIRLCATTPDLNEQEITLRHAVSAFKTDNAQEAYRSFLIARTLDENSFEANYYLGYLDCLQKNYPKAEYYLQAALRVNPEHLEANRYLGLSLYHNKKYTEAAACLQKVLDSEPGDKKSLFNLGQSQYQLKRFDPALKVFTHLRADPSLGAQSCLYAGTIHLKGKRYAKAVTDFEIGLRHESAGIEIELELKYRMAAAYLKQGDMAAAIAQWKAIKASKSDYKDTDLLLAQYLEINKNRNLQTFMMATRSEFVSLCRQLAAKYYPRSSTKLLDISLQKNDYLDILAEVHTSKWDDLVLFRFARTSLQVGELMLRELYSRIKELRAGRGICMTTGTFSEAAHQFTEARLIDLIEKDDLMKVFSRLGSS
jgi:tetratricopeptide (TPR) repeat protein